MVYALSGTVWERELMRNPTRLVAGAFVAAAVAVPLYAAAMSNDGNEVTASPACLAWFGNKDDGKCLSYSNGQPVNVGTPDMGIYGPGAGNNPNGRIGVSTGPLLPSQTWNQAIG
jgi:cbb3-type cytochrome oxidase subunit 1